MEADAVSLSNLALLADNLIRASCGAFRDPEGAPEKAPYSHNNNNRSTPEHGVSLG